MVVSHYRLNLESLSQLRTANVGLLHMNIKVSGFGLFLLVRSECLSLALSVHARFYSIVGKPCMQMKGKSLKSYCLFLDGRELVQFCSHPSAPIMAHPHTIIWFAKREHWAILIGSDALWQHKLCR